MSSQENSEADILIPIAPGLTRRPPMPHLDREKIENDGSCRIRRDVAEAAQDTEALLNAMIGECRFLMREVAYHSMLQTTVASDRLDFLRSAMGLAETGAGVAKTIARLRAVPLLADSLVADLKPPKKSAARRKDPKS